MAKSILIPFRKAINDGYYLGLERNSVEAIYVNLYQLLMTNPHERVELPEYGIGIRRFLFEPADSYTVQELRNIIISQVKRYIPYLSVSSVYIAYVPIPGEDGAIKMVIVMDVRNIETSEYNQYIFNFQKNSVL